MHLTIEELLGVDPPPPYIRVTSRVSDFVEAFVNIVRFSWTPIVELQTLLGPMMSRALRPRPEKYYSRIEWTCVSEDLLPGLAN
jgi:hypothetical protein